MTPEVVGNEMSTTTVVAPAAAGDGNVTNHKVLSGRELEWAINTSNALLKHKETNGNIIRTRFPPEPNGYLHIGHAKSMNMNFYLAFEKLKVPTCDRRTIFRYDDTNPEAESIEYIDSIRHDMEWLGWKPERTTYASDNFNQIYEYAIILIKKGLAYVDNMTKSEMEIQRECAMKRVNAIANQKDPDIEAPIINDCNGIPLLPGRNRNTSIETNLLLFHKMKMGMFTEGSYTLRLKMDFTSPNPNLYDLVAYRIKYTSHPHAGIGWCIYPSYDFTHGTCDSIEDIDYSICTLEFEARREPYYWILWALELYKPNVYEMSRLNLQYTVLSKRRLIKLVTNKYVRGWDDPRMPTISGLRRRGYNANIVNTFCNDVGATRAMNVVEITKLYQTARSILSITSCRIMVALNPIKVIITNFNDIISSPLIFDVQNSPTDPSMGIHTITFTSIIYIDQTDFRLQDSSEYYGLAPNKAVGLKYQGGNLICNEVIYEDNNTNIKELHCTIDNSIDRMKPKTHISWVPDNSIKCEIRLYNELFTVPEPSDLWEDEINKNSEIIYYNAFIDPSIIDVFHNDNESLFNDKWISNIGFQFERFGYFVIDYDTTYHPITNINGNIVFNRTVSLKEEILKKELSNAEKDALEKRQIAARASIANKEERMNINPIDLFRVGDEYMNKYSIYDAETGIPTHDINGIELTKSMYKKLKAEQQKHIKQQLKWKQQQETKA